MTCCLAQKRFQVDVGADMARNRIPRQTEYQALAHAREQHGSPRLLIHSVEDLLCAEFAQDSSDMIMFADGDAADGNEHIMLQGFGKRVAHFRGVVAHGRHDCGAVPP